MDKVFVTAETPAANPLVFDAEKCIGCNQCVNICMIDVLLPNPQKGLPPLVAYPGECWYCGCCVMECALGALRLRHPLMNQPHFERKENLLKRTI